MANNFVMGREMKTNPNVLFRRLGDEMVLFHLETDHFYELNGSAARFWELIHAGSDFSEIRERMTSEFEIDASEFTRDAESLIASLRQAKLITTDD